MDAAAALAEIKVHASANRIMVTDHAWERMEERNVTRRDIWYALTSATGCQWTMPDETWRVSGGKDAGGDPLDVCVVIESGVLIITVM